MTLNRLRRQIDRIDLKLLGLLNRRAALSLRIADLKRKHGHPVWDRIREAQILKHLRQVNGGPLPAQAIQRIFGEILRSGRRLASQRARSDT